MRKINSRNSSGNFIIRVSLFFLLTIISTGVFAQMRQIYVDPVADNAVEKISLNTPSNGFVAFDDWVGYTSDSGKTFIQKYITAGNTNANGYVINTSVFWISGVRSFDANNILVYGSYALVPAILQSTDGGNSFIVRFYSQYDPLQLSTGITDMAFPQTVTVGYAIDADRILKTTNQGVNWTIIRTDPGSYFDQLVALDNNTVIAMCTDNVHNKILRTVNGGTTWANLPLPSTPGAKVRSVFFLNSSVGWLSMYDGDNNHYIFKTINGAVSWTLQNNIVATPFDANKMSFTDANTGYALSYQNTVFKTLNSGAIWEPLPRDNNFAYLGYTHQQLVVGGNLIWAGGGHGFMEMSNNGGGIPLPRAYFLIDTTGVSANGIAYLICYSKTNYTYQWFVNSVLISTQYYASYNHAPTSYDDTIKLVVSNGTLTDTLIKHQFFNVPVPVPTIASFTPSSGQRGSTITITGTNFNGVSAVRFGGTNAVSFNVNSPTNITAVLDSAGTGNIDVVTPLGTATKPGFTSLTPLLTSFSPTSGGTGTVINIIGANLNAGAIHNLKFGAVAAAGIGAVTFSSMVGIVGTGASGNITYQTAYGTATISGFTFVHPPHITSFSPLASDQGGTVTITGTDFTGATAVKFGNIAAASFTVVSPTTVTALVGQGSSGKIFLTTAYGTDSLAGFTYTTPVITSFAPATGGTGSIIHITGINFTGVNTVSFGGTAPASFTVDSDSSITAVVASGASGSISVSSSHGIVTKPGFIYNNSIPIIGSFSPHSGIAGSSVQISGSGFNSVAANNVVYFGGVKATVTSASASLLTVTVPAFAGYQYITVTNNGFTGSSSLAFDISFPGGILTYNTYGTTVNLPSKKNPTDQIYTDLDGDGKADIVIKSDDTLSFYRNTSSGGVISFATRVDIYIQGIGNEFKAADINGDGKPDIVLSKNNTLCVLPNNSTGSAISFGTLVNTGIGTGNLLGMAVGDLTGDGKPDVAFVDGSIFAYQNLSSGSTISFGAGVALFSENNNSIGITLGDFDGDGKMDIAVCNMYQQGSSLSHAVSLFRNTYTVNALSFASNIDYGTPGWYTDIHQTDILGKGKSDLVFGILGYYDAPTNTMTEVSAGGYMQNNSTPGNFSFNLQSFACITGDLAFGMTIGDEDGDGKPDVTSIGTDEFAVARNASVPSTFSFDQARIFGTGTSTPFKIIMVDLNGDSKPEVVISKSGQNKLIIFVNNDPSILIPVCENGGSTISSDITGSTYKWQVNPGGGFVNIVNNANYSGAATHNLVLTNVPLTFNGYQYRCMINTGSVSDISALTVNPVAPASVAISASATNACTGSPVIFTAIPFNGGANPSYQWQVNSVNAGTNSNVFTTAALHTNDSVKVIMTSSSACTIQTIAVSNTITMVNATSIWTAAVDNTWENPGNWSCGLVPDANTNVLIQNGTCIVNSAAICRSLTVMPAVIFTVNSGFAITIAH